jgi:hypothetical protein
MLCLSIFHIRAIHGIFKNSGIWGIAFSDQIRKIPMGSRKQISGRALTGLPLKRHISIWVQAAELISSGASTTRIFETSKKHLGVLCEWDQLDNAVKVVVICFGLTGRKTVKASNFDYD